MGLSIQFYIYTIHGGECKIPDKPAIQAKGMLFCNFFPWVPLKEGYVLGHMKTVSGAKQTRLFHIFVSHGSSKTWAGKEQVWDKWAIFYYFRHSCSCTRRYGANWLLSIYFQPQSETGAVPGNVLAEQMGFMKTRYRVSWLFTSVNLNSFFSPICFILNHQKLYITFSFMPFSFGHRWKVI